MKIVDVAEFYAELGGGVRSYIHQKLRAGAAAGHEVVIIAPGPQDGEEERLGGRILWVRGPKLILDPRYYVLWNERKVRQLLDRERPDVLEGSSPWSGGWFAARWPGEAARSFVFHSDPVATYSPMLLGRRLGPDRVDRMFGLFWRYIRSLAGRFDTTIVSGEWLARRLRGFGVANARAVPLGVDRGRFDPARRSELVRRDWLARAGAPPGAKLLVAVSRFHPEKRVGLLLDAFDRARRQRHLALVIFGDGPLRPLLARKAARIPGVLLAGFTKDPNELADVLASADAFVHASASETYGLAIAEAIVSGLPVVVPEAGGAFELAGPAYSETYPPGHTQACTSAIERLLDRDPAALRDGCQEAASARIARMSEHFDRLFAHYANLLG